MRIGSAGFVSACFLLLIASAPVAYAGLFGYSELGIIKKSGNTFLFIAADGETVDEASLRYAIGRTAKILGFTHFIFEPVVDKPAKKAKASNNDANADAAPIVEEPKPVTRVMVYFYNSPQTRNGVKSIPLSDIDPDHIDTAPVAEEAKPAQTKKKEAASQAITPVVEPAPVVAVEAPAPKKKKEAAPPEVTPVVEPAPVVAVEAPTPKKKKKEAAPQEVTPVAEPAPVVTVEAPAPKKKKKEAAPQEAITVVEPAPVVAVETPTPPRTKPRARLYLLPGDVEQTPEGSSRVQDLGDLFN